MAQFKTREEYEKWKAEKARAAQKATAEKPAVMEQVAPSPEPPHQEPQIETPQPATGKIKKKTEMAGAGCLIQCLGIVFFLVSFYGGPIAIVFGILIMITLFIIGSQKATKYYCATCGNPVENKGVKICPVCKITFK